MRWTYKPDLPSEDDLAQHIRAVELAQAEERARELVDFAGGVVAAVRRKMLETGARHRRTGDPRAARDLERIVDLERQAVTLQAEAVRRHRQAEREAAAALEAARRITRDDAHRAALLLRERRGRRRAS